ncbi:MAG: DUF11 domain-containing protein [Phycisphaera sp.]|nr:DUF11 domain-containing protein [Phycisphaera sp.]
MPTGMGYYANAHDTTRGMERVYADTNHASLYYPGTASSRLVVLEKIVPKEVAIGQNYTYDINVFNLSDTTVKDVMVTDELPEGFTLASSSPSGKAADGSIAWDLGTMAAHETKTIKVTGKATKVGTIKSCAFVTYTPLVCVSTVVVQPSLKLVKSMPSEALLCDTIPIKLTVTNNGTGIAKDVKITDNLPAGLMYTDGKQNMTINAGDLKGGESRTYDLVAKASKTGKFDNKASAVSGSLSDDAAASITIRQPVFAISQESPEKVFLGRTITYCVDLSNKGDATAADTVLVAQLPAGATFVSATEGGTYANGQVTWNVGALAAKGAKKGCVTIKPSAMGDYKVTSFVKGKCAESAQAMSSTKVIGIPAILLEVIDVEDPIEVGKGVDYVITVTNQGSAVGNNITIVAEMEDSMEYVSSSGATKGSVAGKTITFAPLPTLAPQQKASWKVNIKAVKAGDVRFKVKMTSDELTRSVDETEATNFYK